MPAATLSMVRDIAEDQSSPGRAERSAGADGEAGLAHVATASFLASRVVPTGGFAVALAGGVALARAAQRAGARVAYGASIAAMLQTVAIMGPARFGIPLTQALSAPLLGRLHARGAAFALQLAACAAIRFADQLLATAFYIWIVAGGLDVYAATFDALLGDLPILTEGPTTALLTTAAGLLAWTMFASTVQVAVYRRALLGWPAAEAASATRGAAQADPGREPQPAARRSRPRYDPRAVTLAAVVAFVALLVSTAWILLVAVGAWLALAWVTARGDRQPVRAGLALAAMLAGGALVFGFLGGGSLDLTVRRTIRAALLVLVATWLRAAAGEEGVREVARRALLGMRRVPAAAEASAVLERLGRRGGLAASGRALIAAVRHERRRPAPLAGAVLGWITGEASRFSPPAGDGARTLRARQRDRALVAVALAAAATAALPD